MRILLWHVHGSWTTAFVQGGHQYLLPVDPLRDADGLGRARTWDWPPNVVEVPLTELAATGFDLAVLQRPHEFDLVRALTGLVPGVDVPAVYLEHNAPDGAVPDTRHPMAGRPGLRIVHVTGFNELFWDCGGSPTQVIEHGVVDPGERWTGELERAAVVVNDPLRRGRTVGTDLLPRFAAAAPLDVFGMRVEGLPEALGLADGDCRAVEDLPQARMHEQLARRRVYLHPVRWTSLGLSLIEAMHLGMPVVALGCTEVYRAVPPAAGVVSTHLGELCDGLAAFLRDPQRAADAGRAARAAALARYGLERFLKDWDELITESMT